MSFLGEMIPDPVGVVLGTGYMRFESACGIDGLAKVTGDRLDILAVAARTTGKGQFRKFITLAKQEFKTVCVWEDWNPILGPALARYGFTPEKEIQADGEVVDGWRWDADK